jgi:hypothetical protein
MPDKPFTIGAHVRVVALPPYLKTAEPMPMLRPPDLIAVGEIGTVLQQKPGSYWSVRFERGAFLIDSRYLEPEAEATESS